MTSDDWSLKIFFSVDLVGSSSFKAKKMELEDDYEWCWAFEDFFKNFQIEFKEQYIKLKKCYFEDIQAKTPFAWKMLGDELLFYSPLSDYKEVPLHILSFRGALLDYNEKLRKKPVPILRCKGTVWIAGFPLHNIEVNIDEGPIDFIGPSIDAGFRLTKLSTERKLVMSIDTALLFCDAITTIREAKGGQPDYIIRYDGKVELKGVYNNTPYPVFWIDNYPDKNKSEDLWLGMGSPCDAAEIVKFATEFISSHDYLIVPFIFGGKEKYNQILEKYEKRKREALKQRKENEMSTLAEPSGNEEDLNNTLDRQTDFLESSEQLQGEK